MSDGSARFTPREVADLLGVTSAALRAELTTLPGPVLSWHPAPGEWCAKEVVGHLIEAERRGFAGRIRFILDHDEPGLTAWDPAAVTRERRDCGRDMMDLLRELTELRGASVALVGDLRESDLERGGHHPEVGHVRVADLLHEWIHHDRNHIRQILANVQAFVWPAMGNTQRFSQP
jgi:DinB superfamily